jgi:hypothetical protein
VRSFLYIQLDVQILKLKESYIFNLVFKEDDVINILSYVCVHTWFYEDTQYLSLHTWFYEDTQYLSLHAWFYEDTQYLSLHTWFYEDTQYLSLHTWFYEDTQYLSLPEVQRTYSTIKEKYTQ